MRTLPRFDVALGQGGPELVTLLPRKAELGAAHWRQGVELAVYMVTGGVLVAAVIVDALARRRRQLGGA